MNSEKSVEAESLNCIHWTGKTVFELLHIMLYKYSFGVVHFLTILGAWSRYLHCRKNYSMIFGAPLFEECPSWSNESDLSTKRTKPKPSKNDCYELNLLLLLLSLLFMCGTLASGLFRQLYDGGCCEWGE